MVGDAWPAAATSGHRHATLRQSRQRHAHQAGDDPTGESVARLLGDAALGLHPTDAPPRDVGSLQFSFVNGWPTRSNSNTPSAASTPVIQASSTPDPVRTLVLPEPSPMRTKPAPARCGSPRLPTLAASGSHERSGRREVPPQIGVQHPVLEIPVRSSHRAVEPGGTKMPAERCAQDRRRGSRRSPARDTRRLEHSAARASNSRGGRPPLFAPTATPAGVAFRKPKLFVELSADGPDGPSRSRERRADVHPGRKPASGRP